MKSTLPHWAALLGLLSITVVWGSSFPLVNVAMRAHSPLFFLSVRFAIAAAVMFPLAHFRGGLGLREKKSALVCGLFLFLGFAFQTAGLVRTTSARAAFVTGLSTVLVPLFERVFFKKRFGLGVKVGVGLSFAGLVLLALSQGSLGEGAGGEEALRRLSGDALVFGCALSFAGLIMALDRYGRKESVPALAAWQMLFVAAVCVPLSLVFEPNGWVWPTQEVWASLAFLAVVCTAVVTVAQIHFQRFTTATQAALVFAMEPVFAALFAWWWQGEKFGVAGYVGSAAMLAGCVLASLPANIFTKK